MLLACQARLDQTFALAAGIQHLLLFRLLFLDLETHLACEILALLAGRRLLENGHQIGLAKEFAVVVDSTGIWWWHDATKVPHVALLPGNLLGQGVGLWLW